MASRQNLAIRTGILLTLLLNVLSAAVVCHAQASAAPADVLATAGPSVSAASDASSAEEAPPADPLPQDPGQRTGPFTTSDGWRGAVSIYGWFPGVHGTVGALGHEAGFSAPFSDVFHYLKGVIPIAVEADKGRFVMPIDYFWVKLANGKATPFTDLTGRYFNVHLTESIFTPKVGYRLYDGEHFKVDALAGIRYWYVGQNLQLIGTQVAVPAFVKSANWVDGIGGARFIIPLAEKAAISISGDAGAGGANLDYNVVGLFTYNFKPKIGLALGWRYLYEDYRPSNHQFVLDTTMSGAIAGLYFNFGGKPPIPPTASCSVSPTEVFAGDPVSATINAQNFNPKHTVAYRWSSTGAKVTGAGTTASVDTTGLAPGSYTVTGTAIDEKEKKNNSASCNATFSVKEKPQHPPVVSCSVSPSTVQPGSPVAVVATVSSPDNSAISSVAYTTSAGKISGSGNNASEDTTGLPSGPVTVTVTATDARGLTGTGTCSFGVEVPPPPPSCSTRTPIEFVQRPNQKYIPWRVDNTAKAILDDDASALKNDPNAKIVVVGYADGEPPVYEGKGKKRQPIDLAAQRAVNVKAYLVQQQGIDPSRIEVRKGTGKDHTADIIWIPQGSDVNACANLQNTTPVDESVVKPSENAYPKPKSEAPVHHRSARKATAPTGN